MPIIRKTTQEDIPAVDRLYQAARAFMRREGNLSQWDGPYPGRADIAADIRNGIGYVVEEEGEILAAFAFFVGEEPTYRHIDGAWQNNRPYGVIHRIAVAKHGYGLAALCFNYGYRLCGNLRIDTHQDNRSMRRALEKNGFAYCGVIHLQDGAPRLAYQKCGL